MPKYRYKLFQTSTFVALLLYTEVPNILYRSVL